MIEKKVLFLREAISINEGSKLFQKIYFEIKKQSELQVEKRKHFRLHLTCTYNEFCHLFSETANALFLSKGLKDEFVIDKHNEPILQQLFLYASQNGQFGGDLNRGIMLQGKYGCGKTVIMETYCILHNMIINHLEMRIPLFTFLRSIELQNQIIEHGIKHFQFRPLVIDEFGRESKTVTDYGNVSRPVSELLSLRGDTGAVTHGTTNFTLQTLASTDFYGQMIGDRLNVMFNFMEMKGTSRRK